MKTNLEEKSVKTHIEIEGVILTPELINRLKDFQERDNENVDNFINVIAEAVCFIARNIYMFHEHQEAERKQALQVIADISILRDYMKEFKKP